MSEFEHPDLTSARLHLTAFQHAYCFRCRAGMTVSITSAQLVHGEPVVHSDGSTCPAGDFILVCGSMFAVADRLMRAKAPISDRPNTDNVDTAPMPRARSLDGPKG